jgi:hypothetical protein
MGPLENLTACPVPPERFNVARENIPHGEVTLVEYDSDARGRASPAARETHRASRARSVTPSARARCETGRVVHDYQFFN